MASDNKAPREIVQAVDRCFAVIKAFGRERGKLTQIQVAEASGLSRATARRFLQTLELLGYVRREGRYYSLQPRMLDLGYAYLSSRAGQRISCGQELASFPRCC